MNSPISFLTNLRQDRLQRSEMFSWNKIINGLKRSRGIIDPFTTFNHRVENVIKQLVHTSAVRSSRYEAHGKFGEHERCLRASLASWVYTYIPHMYKPNKISTFFVIFSLWTLLSIFSYILLASLCRYSIPLKIPLKWYIIRGIKVHRSHLRKIWHFPYAVKV